MGIFYLVRKNRLFFVGLLVYNSTHLLKSTMLFLILFLFVFAIWKISVRYHKGECRRVSMKTILSVT